MIRIPLLPNIGTRIASPSISHCPNLINIPLLLVWLIASSTITILHVLTPVHASFCGEAAIPFSFEVRPDGHPVLGCARPNCFGWDVFGQPIRANDTNFYRVNKGADGFFRRALASNAPKPLGARDFGWYRPQTATCESEFKAGGCAANQWVGGIAPILERNSNDGGGGGTAGLSLRCCQWNGLAAHTAVDRGVAIVKRGQIVYGGEVLLEEGEKRQYAFDYVSNVVRIPDSNDNGGEQTKESFHYEVSIHRIACLPRPEQLVVDTEPGVEKELLRRFSLAAEKEAQEESAAGTAPGALARSGKPQQQQKAEKSKQEKQPPQQQQQQWPYQQQKQPQQKQNPNPKQQPRHGGESRVIKTDHLFAGVEHVDNDAGADQQPEQQQQQQHHEHIQQAMGNRKAFAAAPHQGPIQGPFGENDIDNAAAGVQDDYYDDDEAEDAEKDKKAGNGQQQQQQAGDSRGKQLLDVDTGGAGGATINGGPVGPVPEIVKKAGIICDRNVTRAAHAARRRRQAECVEIEIELPPGYELESIQEEGGETAPAEEAAPAEAPYYYQPTWYSYYMPATTPRSCFTGDTRVQLANGQKGKRMDELALNDWILSANGTHLVYSLVESWMHRLPKQWAQFVRIELADGHVLKLTAEHFIYKRSDCLHRDRHTISGPVPVEQIHAKAEMVWANRVRPGDCLFVVPDEQQEKERNTRTSSSTTPIPNVFYAQPVVRVSTIREQGIYAPMTGTGNLLVNGVFASCFAVEPSSVLQRSVFINKNSDWNPSPSAYGLVNTLLGGGYAENDAVIRMQLNSNNDALVEADISDWLRFIVDYLMPVVLPK